MEEGLFCAPPPRPTVKTGLFTPAIIKDNLLVSFNIMPTFYSLLNKSGNFNKNLFCIKTLKLYEQINQSLGPNISI